MSPLEGGCGTAAYAVEAIDPEQQVCRPRGRERCHDERLDAGDRTRSATDEREMERQPETSPCRFR